MLEIQIQITASSVAWYGAIVATSTAIIQGVLVFRDRKRVKVKIDKNIRIIGPLGSYPYKEGVDYAVIRIINTGRRKVTIENAGAKLLDGQILQPVDILKIGQVTLEEGNKHDIFVEQEKLDFSKIAYFYAKDTTGVIYKKIIAGLPRRIFWFFKRLFQRLKKGKLYQN
jgi:hypothetical protein